MDNISLTVSNNMPNAEERLWATLAHLSSFLGGLLTSPTAGWGCFVGPLIVWLIKRNTMPFVDDQGKEAFNFNITLGIFSLALFLLVTITFGLGLIIAVPLWVMLAIYWLVFTIIASFKANQGEQYRYPLTLRIFH
ncbi:DUF4870 domain-containing protein [Candidatus Nitrosacidococcus tergens]|uniref:Orotate phosphoribosyltransferase n=1 Tax=Candidatus Nitrosacidococcus tergens TaxID=553981 RepID=A0A7G1Q8P4_9GAMM|nr:DUF4870 domain-containing protein [Candidatus Nitrosacidococcus tergens]CAB1275319.1 conserved membrane protein of unknown function [Candidatus Nitrosacidococcus tergens]